METQDLAKLLRLSKKLNETAIIEYIAKKYGDPSKGNFIEIFFETPQYLV